MLDITHLPFYQTTIFINEKSIIGFELPWHKYKYKLITLSIHYLKLNPVYFLFKGKEDISDSSLSSPQECGTFYEG